MNSLNIAALSCVDIQKMNKGELTDISSMKLDPSVPQELRAAYMLKEMGNPYCLRESIVMRWIRIMDTTSLRNG